MPNQSATAAESCGNHAILKQIFLDKAMTLATVGRTAEAGPRGLSALSRVPEEVVARLERSRRRQRSRTTSRSEPRPSPSGRRRSSPLGSSHDRSITRGCPPRSMTESSERHGSNLSRGHHHARSRRTARRSRERLMAMTSAQPPEASFRRSAEPAHPLAILWDFQPLRPKC